MRALVYLEYRYALNAARSIVRAPGRLVLWAVYLLSIALFAVVRFARPRSYSVYGSAGITHGVAIAFAGGLLLLTGFAIVAAAAGRTATFRSPAEAILLSNAGLRPLVIAVWLELRKIAGGWTRSVGGFLYAFLVFVPLRRTGPLAFAGSFVATVLLLTIPQTAGLPAFLLARGPWKRPVAMAGRLLAALGAGYIAAGASGPRLWRPLVLATHVDPALAVAAALRPEPLAFAAPLLIFTAFVVVVAVLGDDALPELYAASTSLAPARTRLLQDKGGTPVPRRSLRRTPARERVLPGAGAILWKDWIALRRNPRVLQLWLAGACVWIACGAGAAAATQHFDDPTALVTIAAVVALVIVFWAPYSASTGLAEDVAKPLFWLSTAPLRSRLAAWALARAWRGAVGAGCGAASAALVLGNPAPALVCVPIALIAYWSLNALGIGLYAAFPNPLDARGPTALLRFAAALAYLVPPAVTAMAAAFAHLGAAGATATFFIGLAAEGWLVIELVALRFAEHGATLRTISNRT